MSAGDIVYYVVAFVIAAPSIAFTLFLIVGGTVYLCVAAWALARWFFHAGRFVVRTLIRGARDDGFEI